MVLDPLLKLMAEKRASDLFFSPGAPIHIKIQGVVMPVNNQVLDAEATRRITYELLSPEQAKSFEENWEMNFAFAREGIGSFRVNVFRQRGHISLVIRYLAGVIPSIEELKLPPVFKDLVMEKRGLVLVVGATSSGKSTSLASMVQYRNATRTGHILTVEDPIEYVFRHDKSIVSQREIGIDTHSYAQALSNAMREAPDMLMIGEIRDRETLQHALIYAQTGHLCLATLHANNSYHALNRIINFFPHEARESLLMDLSVSLRCVISQRLIKGVDGKLVPAVEVLLNTVHIAELIKNGETDQIKEAMEQSLSPGSQSFEQDLYRLYAGGEITLEEALVNSDSPTNLSWLINNAKAAEKGGAAPKAPEPEAPALTLNLDRLEE